MFKRILVPVDLTQKAGGAVDAAYELAKQSGAQVVLLHVIETIEHIDADEVKSLYDRLESNAHKVLDKFAEKFDDRDGVVEKSIVFGHRIQEIVDFAVRNRTDLIIMASHRIDPEQPGRGWSSISYAVAILSPCPVLLVK